MQVIGMLSEGYWHLTCEVIVRCQVTGRLLVGSLAYLQIICSLVGGTGRLCAVYWEVIGRLCAGYQEVIKGVIGLCLKAFVGEGKL